MTHLLRFADLRARGVVSNWVQLRRLQQHHNFPTGLMLSRKCPRLDRRRDP
jgi:hypothetical protein